MKNIDIFLKITYLLFYSIDDEDFLVLKMER